MLLRSAKAEWSLKTLSMANEVDFANRSALAERRSKFLGISIIIVPSRDCHWWLITKLLMRVV